MKRKHLMWAAAIIAVIAAALFLCNKAGWYLVIRDGDTGQVCAKYPLDEGDSFAVGFIHSVNKSPLIDVYYIEDKQIYVEETIYYGFGAGVQTELNPGEELSYGPDGAMIVSNIHKCFSNGSLLCSVGMASDKTLLMGDVLGHYTDALDRVGVYVDEAETQVDIGELRVVSLSNVCGRYSVVSINYQWQWF